VRMHSVVGSLHGELSLHRSELVGEGSLAPGECLCSRSLQIKLALSNSPLTVSDRRSSVKSASLKSWKLVV
jgi:hypothetical protein